MDALQETGRRTLRPLLAMVVALALLFAVSSTRAETYKPRGPEKGIAKRQTKAKITKQGDKVVKNSCRSMGRGGKHGVKCNWVAARLVGSTKTRKCRGYSLLPRRAKRIRFKTRSCRTDKGATSTNRLLPRKLLKGGYESTYVFCFTTLGKGYRCKWKALSFAPEQIQLCRGTGRAAKRRTTYKVRACSTDQALTSAQTGVEGELATRGLAPGLVSCRPGDSISCSWIAYKASGGWTYHCEGKATAPGPEGPFAVGRCNLRAPELAPLKAKGSDRLFGVNEIWNSRFFRASLPQYAAELQPETARFPLSWNGSQSAEGGPIVFDPSVIIAYTVMLARGIRPILILQSAPCWAITKRPPKCNGTTSGYAPSPAHLDSWRAFTAAVARTFPEAAAFEIWNEANADIYFKGGPNSNRINPAEYARILINASAGIRSVTTSVPILTSGTAAFSTNVAGEQMRYDDFLRAVYEVPGTKAASDGIGHHTYTGSGPGGDSATDVRAQIANLKDVMIDFGDQDKPIWITEFGASTTASPRYTEAQQRRTLVELHNQFRRIPGVAASIIHRWRDDPGSAHPPSRGFGLTRANLTRKPAYCGLAKTRTGLSPGNC